MKILGITILITLSYQLFALFDALNIGLQKNKFTPYNMTESKRFAKHAAINYCPENTVKDWSCKPCKQIPQFTDLTYIASKVGKIQGYMGYDPEHDWIVASWRGTNNVENLILDLDFQKTTYEYCRGCQVHQGFLIAYRTVHHKAAEVMRELITKYKDSKIIVTGHSLGGALATLSALQLTVALNIGADRLVLHNFGAPRVGNVKFANYLKSKINTSYRVVRDKDYAPHLPPQGLQYRQEAYEVWYNKDMTEYKICDQSGEDKTCSNQYFPNYSFDEHWFYFQNIKNDQEC